MKTLWHNIGVTLAGIAVTALIVGAIFGGWLLERKIHYKWGYQSQVETQVKPLVERIEKLEKRVSDLEKK